MRISPRDRMLLGIIPVLALGAAFYVLLLTPQRHRAAALETKITAAQTQLGSAQQAWSTGHAAQVKLARDQQEYAASSIAVPNVSNVPAMLRLLQSSANQVDVSIETISLSGASGSSASAGTSAPSTTQGGTTPIPVSLTFSGGYQALDRLVGRLDRYVVVTDNGLHVDGPLFGISSVTESPDSGAGLTIQLTTDIYQYAAASSVDGSSTEGSS